MPTKLAKLAPLLGLDLQIARVPQRIKLASLAQLPGRITVDAQGLALRDASSGRWSWQFPGQAVAANLSLQAQLNRLLSGLNMSMTRLQSIGTAKGPELYRFDIVQIVRITAANPPQSLYRGQVLLPGRALDMPAIAAWSARWADQLMGRLGHDGHFAGTFEPSYNRYDPRQGSSADAALACYALADYSRSSLAAPARARACAAAAQRGLARLLSVLGAAVATTTATQTVIPHTRDPSMTLLALLQLPGTSRHKQSRDRLVTWLLESFSTGKGFRRSPNIQSTLASPPVGAAAALALVRIYDQTREPRCLATAKLALSLLWADAVKRHADDIMPWAALAEFELARLGQPTSGLLMAQAACNTMWEHQVKADLDSSQSNRGDLIGGFQMSGSLIDEPTWLSAGPLIALADALTVKHFINAEDRPAWMVNVALGLRFCAQLTMTQASAYYVQDWKRAVGAVRSSFYDNRQPTAATAYALLAAAEFQKAMGRLAEGK